MTHLPPKPADTRMTRFPIWYLIDPDLATKHAVHPAIIGVCFDGEEADQVLRSLAEQDEVSERAYAYVGSGERSPTWARLYDARPEAGTTVLLQDDAVAEDLLRDVDGLPDDEARNMALQELVRACWASMVAGQRAAVRLAFPPTPRVDPPPGPVRATHIDETAALMCGLKPGWYGVRADGARRGPYEGKGSALTSWAAFGLSVTDCPFQEDPTSGDGYTVYSFNRRHRSFKSPEEVGLGPRDDAGNVTVEDEALKAKFEAGLAYILSYSEHGLCQWSIGEGVSDWDSTAVAGVMVLDPDYAEHLDATERRARAELLAEEYTAWSNGEVYEVKFLVDGEEVEDEGGTFYGVEGVKRWLNQVCERRHIDPKPRIVWPWERV